MVIALRNSSNVVEEIRTRIGLKSKIKNKHLMTDYFLSSSKKKLYSVKFVFLNNVISNNLK